MGRPSPPGFHGASPRAILREGLAAATRDEVSAAEIGRLFDDL